MSARVLIADDHPLCAEVLGLVVQSVQADLVIDAAGTLAEAEALIRQHGAPALALLDLMLPDSKGFAGLLLIQRLAPSTPIAIVSALEDPDVVRQAAQLGAVGFVPKSTGMPSMKLAITELLDTGQYYPEGIDLDAGPSKDEEKLAQRLSALTAAQLRVLMALTDGRLNKQIAGDMDISEATVKAHVSAILSKLKVNNRTQAVLAVNAFPWPTAQSAGMSQVA